MTEYLGQGIVIKLFGHLFLSHLSSIINKPVFRRGFQPGLQKLGCTATEDCQILEILDYRLSRSYSESLLSHIKEAVLFLHFS